LAAAQPGIERRGAALFLVGPGDRVRYEWRDRFAGDPAPMAEVVATAG